MENIAKTEYKTMANIFDHINQTFFSGKLPSCMITLTRHPKSFGYYSANRFKHREEGTITDEISLNPEKYPDRTNIQIISTLAHEMCHLWQQHFGKTSRNSYHNKEWANKMIEIGLTPSNTGEPDGKITGQKMSHYVTPNGKFELEMTDYLKENKINWQSIISNEENHPEPISKKKSKIKYTCPVCGQNAWAKPEAKLICGDCKEEMESGE